MPKQRKIQNRDVRKRILIICEGLKTEPNYFSGIKKDLRSTALNIEIIDRPENSGLRLVKHAIILKKEADREDNKFDSIWIVLDKDKYTELEETFTLAKKNDINIAFSAISFELWYLLHFTYTTKPWRSYAQLKDELLKHLPDYDKSHSDMYERLKNKTSTAVNNAVKLRDYFKGDIDSGVKLYDLDCYTDVDRLVMLLIQDE